MPVDGTTGRGLTLKVNGRTISTAVEGRMLLVDFLRAPPEAGGPGLTGTHIGCDTSQCGACLVHVDGRLVKSCTMLALEAAGAEVTTIEGMAGPDGTLSRIQQAFQDHHGLQCGFCTPGMVMATAALLAEVPQPSIAQVREHLEGNLCRCTGYHNIIRAVLAASGRDVTALAE